MGNCNCSTPSRSAELVVSTSALPIGTSSIRTVKRMGWKPDVPDFRDRVLELPSHQRASLPPKVDLRPAENFEVYDQGHLGSCTANAIAGAFHFAMVKEGLKSDHDFRPSRLFIYYNEREMEGNTGTDSGAQIRDGIKSVNKVGVCSEKLWPYVEDTFTNKPSEECYTAALQDRAVEYARVPVALEDMKACLAQGTPYVFGFMVFSSFMSPEVAQTGMMPMPSVYEKLCGGHAVMAVGYDDEMQCFIVRNSWGPDWGVNGYFYMPYDVMTNPLMVQDPWAINFVDGKQLPTKPIMIPAEPVRRFGWKADKPDDRDLVVSLPASKKQGLAPKVDLRPKENFEVYDQGHLGSCTANAIGGAFHFAMVQEGLKQDWRPSRLFVYYNERDMEGTVAQDSGAAIRDGIKSVNTLGVCSEIMWPYNEDTFTSKPSPACYQAALQDRAISYSRVYQSEEDLKGVLADGYPFVFGFMVYSSFMSQEVAKTGEMPWPAENEKLCGGHAVMAVGYDDEKKVFIVRNSWGEGWGDKGYFYMPYEYMTNPELVHDIWTIMFVEGKQLPTKKMKN